MKSFKMFLLSLSAAALLLASIPAPVADAAGSEKSKIVVKNVKDVDKKLLSKAKKALKPYITGDIEFETVEYNWVIGGKKAPTIRTKAFRTEKYSDEQIKRYGQPLLRSSKRREKLPISI